MQDLLEALASYTQRHFVRVDRLVRSSFLLDYTLASMNVLMPEEDDLPAEGQEPFADPAINGVAGHSLQSQRVRADTAIEAVLANHHCPDQLDREDATVSGADQEGAEPTHVQTADFDTIHLRKQAAAAQTEGDKKLLSKHKSGKVTRRHSESSIGSGKVKRKKSKVAG